MREIKFRGLFHIEREDVGFSAMIPNVCVYSDGSLGCSEDNFTKAIQHTGWRFDNYDEYFIDSPSEGVEPALLDFGYANVSVNDDWVVFDGIPMQFTGLRDREGTEIYERDIVEMPHWEPSRWLVDWSDELGGFYFRHNVEQPYDICHPMRYLERATVIGNLHQNPELLEDTK